MQRVPTVENSAGVLNAALAACHARIDPPGFALEAFDPVGGRRQRIAPRAGGSRRPSATAWPDG
jgi:hypothetical protein